MQEALDKVEQEPWRRAYLEELCADYAILRGQPRATAELDKEMALWDDTSNDELQDS
jgi:hypothetical protein